MHANSSQVGTIDAGSHYLWDNWLCHFEKDGLLHRFSLAAPRTLESAERHFHAAIHHWTTSDGKQWRYRGIAVERGLPDSFDGQAAWSGCAVDLGPCLALFYTGLGVGDDRRQTIAVAFAEDGLHFTKQARPILEPGGEELGYHLGDEDGVVMAWRDPFVFQPPDSGEWHMVFSAKRERPVCRGGFAHAVALDQSLLRWELRPPIDLPNCYHQMECPAILYQGDYVYCVASTKDRAVDGAAEANTAIRAWRATKLEGPWEPAGAGGRDLILDHDHNLYAATFVRLPGEGNQVYATGFFSESDDVRAYTWAPIMPVVWHGASPRVVTLPLGKSG